MKPRAICLLPYLAACMLVAADAVADDKQNHCEERHDVSVGALDESTWKQLNAIYELFAEERYDDAYEQLRMMLAQARPDEYLQATLHQAMGQVEWARGNYRPALLHLETAVESDALPNAAHVPLLYQLAQLYFIEGRLDEALARLQRWFCAVQPEKVTAASWVLKAFIQAQQGQFAAALEAIDAAIAMDENPQESWYQMKLAAHYELEQYPQAAETLAKLIARWPERKGYWTQLSQIRYRLQQDQRALAAQALAHRQGLLDEQSDITYLAALYSSLQLPYKSAQVLEQGIRDGIVDPSEMNWTLVADAWYAARELERALIAYARAGNAASDGSADLRRGFLLVDLERWQEAKEALNQALAKGGLDNAQYGKVYLLRGLAQFSLGDLDSANSDWNRAATYEDSREAARQWISYLQEERRRRAS